MSLRLDLTRDEREELKRLLATVGGQSGPTSLNDFLAQWAGFVAAVERGYDDSIYEYANDLSVRDRLQDLAGAAPSTLRTKLESALAPVDARFVDATEDAARPLSESRGDLRMWWRRVPKRRTGELAQDLEALGHMVEP